MRKVIIIALMLCACCIVMGQDFFRRRSPVAVAGGAPADPYFIAWWRLDSAHTNEYGFINYADSPALAGTLTNFGATVGASNTYFDGSDDVAMTGTNFSVAVINGKTNGYESSLRSLTVLIRCNRVLTPHNDGMWEYSVPSRGAGVSAIWTMFDISGVGSRARLTRSGAGWFVDHPYATNRWYVEALTMSVTASNVPPFDNFLLSSYTNGIFVGSVTNAESAILTNRLFRVGNYFSDSFDWRGYISEIRVYTRPLSSSEVFAASLEMTP